MTQNNTKVQEVRKVGFNEGLIQLCCCITIISLVWAVMFPLYEDLGWWADLLFSFLFGIGAIGIYIPISFQIKKSFDWLEGLKDG